MKLDGKVLDGPVVETVVIPRSTGDLVFKAKAVLDFDDFEKLCPAPEAPTILRRGETIPAMDTTDPKYNDAVTKWAENRTHWMILESLSATEGLEWELIDRADPSTWDKYQEEFKKAGFSALEIGVIVNAVIGACGLSQEKIDEATKSFLAIQGAQKSE